MELLWSSQQEEGLNEVKERLSKNDNTSYKRLRGVMEVLRKDCELYGRWVDGWVGGWVGSWVGSWVGG